jgi:hypothetical protein
MKILLYVSYGTGSHEHEVIFSLLSALHWTDQETSDLRFLILTDQPDHFADVPAMVEFIKPEQWRAWSGPTTFNHRCKILALQHAVRKYQVPIALLDADTWFRKSPRELLNRVAPGKTVMHIREGTIAEYGMAETGKPIVEFVSGHRFVSRAGRDISIPLRAMMWNAGVIGLHPSDWSVLDEVLDLTDQFCARSNFDILEQLAFSYVLSQRTRLKESYDVVFHYWVPFLREPFRQKLPEIMRQCANLPLSDRVARCYAQRPRLPPTASHRGKVVIKRCLEGLGLLRGRLRYSEGSLRF